MKIVKQGGQVAPAQRANWIGRRFKCSACQTQVELEAGDPVKSTIERRPDGNQTLEFNCPSCGNAMVWTGKNEKIVTPPPANGTGLALEAPDTSKL